MARFILACALLGGLAACGDTDLERGATGAAAGVATATVIDADPLTGAVIGGAVGVISDDVRRELARR